MLLQIVVTCLLAPAALGRDHTIVGPKEFRVGSVNNVVLNFHGYAGTATVTADLQTQPQRQNRFAAFQRDNVDVTLPLDLPFMVEQSDLVEPTPFRNAYVELNIQVTNSNEDFEETIPVLLNFTSGYIFLTTDRPAYRPGDTVKVIAALTDQHLMPGNGVDVDIVVKTPEEESGTGKIGVDKVTRTASARDFMAYEYHVPALPLLGKWFIEASAPALGISTEATFLVDKYALPTFNVKVQMEQHYILPTENTIRGTIHAEYSYGKKITGSYYIIVKLERRGEIPHSVVIFREPSRFTRRATIRNGIKNFSIPIAKVNNALADGETLADLVAEGASLTIEVAVTGKAESIYESGIASGIRFTSSPYEIVTDRSSRYFSPGIVYEVKADVLDAVTKQPEAGVPVQVSVGGVVKIKTSNQRGEIKAAFDRTAVDILDVQLTTMKPNLNANDQATANFMVQRHRANALMSISINSLVPVGEAANARFRFEPPDVSGSVNYYVVSKGQVVLSGVIPVPPNHRGDITWDIDITPHMVPSSRLVAYYMRGNELISNSVWFDVTNVCNGNELRVQTSEAEVRPERPIDITISGNPGARIHLSAVDRAAYFVYNGSRLTRDVMWNKMQEYDNACSREGGSNNKNVFEEAGVFIVNKAIRPSTYSHPTCPQPVPRKRRQAEVTSNPDAAREAYLDRCERHGKLDNLGDESCVKRKNRLLLCERDVECAERFWRSCFRAERLKRRYGYARANNQVRAVNAMNENEQRSNFEENWLWITENLDNNGVWNSRNKKAPGSISTFEFTAFSSSNEGFCVAKPRQVVVFQRVFIQLYLPYSVRRMEQASIRYAIFNYYPNAIRVSVEMSHGPELCSRFPANEEHQIAVLNVPGNSAKSSHFTVMPIKIPDLAKGVRIDMTATSPDGTDSLVKYLLVEPNGLLNESSRSYVLAPPANAIIDLQVPDDGFEPDTRRCWIYAYANILGPIAVPDPISKRYNNLQSLIHQPNYCGEQNMIRTAPIVYIYKYRLATNIVEAGGPEEAQTIQYIKRGYEIELKWRSDKALKKAWAVWNTRPPSVWLNAFVDRVFLEASEIDRDMTVQPICNSLGWLLGVQQPDGRFVESYSVIHREMDGLTEGDIAMTAYVAATLSIAIQPEPQDQACPAIADEIREKRDLSLAYLNNQFIELSNNVYVAAVTAYGLAVSGSPMAISWIGRLRQLCTENEQHIYCQAAGGQAGRVETTSYALLAEITALPDQATEIELRRIRKMALWLVEQRNSFGGSQTTQDTVMALQASAEYMKWIHRINAAPPPTNMDVTLSSDPGTAWHNEPQVVHLDDENQVLQHEIEVPPNVIGTTIRARITGNGEASLSYRCVWRENIDGERCPFQIDVVKQIRETNPAEPDENEVILTLKITVHKLEAPSAGMSIIDVGLLSGFVPIQQTIEDLSRDKRLDGIADNYEITDNSVKFYLNEIPHESNTVIAFKLRQDSIVSNPQPAGIKVYDYYNPEISCTKFYSKDDAPELRVACNNADKRSTSICKCAEGGCPRCRTREEVATDSKCIYLQVAQPQADKQCLGNDKTCKKGAGCHDTKAKVCQRHYLMYVVVTGVRKNHPPNFVEFNATVLRSPLTGIDTTNGTKTFRMRFDCFENCRDDALTKNNQVDVIKEGRNLIIYGNEPQRKHIGGVTSYLYYLDHTSYIEVTPSTKKCTKTRRKFKCSRDPDFLTKDCIRKRICIHHEKLRKKVFRGCG